MHSNFVLKTEKSAFLFRLFNFNTTAMGHAAAHSENYKIWVIL